MRRKNVPMNQLEIAVPPQAGRVVAELTGEDVDAEYARLMGEEALRRQREAYKEAHSCTCGKGDEHANKFHAPGCHKRPLTKAGNRSVL